ncbi:uncharacterized protein LOC142162191 [Nicotiana tabacum]|uniref:Uncharacterized protein LOC142162191 n=1 Tax=Nicotiana tabacum TaxID=4097 RepID=A0AC58RPE2_TOBAC
MKDFVSLNIHQEVPYAMNKYIGYDHLSPKYQAFVVVFSSTTGPATYAEASKDLRWISAMKEEIKALESNNTWKLVALPEGKKLIGYKWIYKIKYQALGEIERFKARLYDEHIWKDDKLEANPTVDQAAYQRLIGKLLYLTVTRPDISFGLQTLSQFLQQPRNFHMEAALRIIKSSVEAEYMSLAATMAELTWLLGMLKEIDVEVNLPVDIFTDSKAVIQIAANHDTTRELSI